MVYQRSIRKGLDRISELPDTILCLILSFLNTKSAVKTSALSKRWKHVWTKVPRLDITDMPCSRNYSVEQRVCFKSFVNNVLLYNDVSYLQHLCVHISTHIDDFNVNSWLNAMSWRETMELTVILDMCGYELNDCYSLPARFLRSDKLVILKLEGYIKIDSSVSFQLPSLKTIHLKNVNFPDDEFMRRFSSSCPSLRELRIVTCFGLTASLNIDSLTLESLQITNVFDHSQYEEIMPCISIKAPNLSSSVDDAYAYQLLRKVSGVQTLQLRANDIEYDVNLPVFHNLTCLKLEPYMFMDSLLKCAPKLEELILRSTEHWSSGLSSNSAPEILPCLESVVICEFVGWSEDFSFVKYILKAARVLKQLRISMNLVEEDSKASVYERLLMLRRTSPNCQVKIVHDVESEFPIFCMCRH